MSIKKMFITPNISYYQFFAYNRENFSATHPIQIALLSFKMTRIISFNYQVFDSDQYQISNNVIFSLKLEIHSYTNITTSLPFHNPL